MKFIILYNVLTRFDDFSILMRDEPLDMPFVKTTTDKKINEYKFHKGIHHELNNFASKLRTNTKNLMKSWHIFNFHRAPVQN